MPARKEEIEHAKEEGIEFLLLTNPTKILGDEKAGSAAWSAPRWNWVSRMLPDAVVPLRLRASEFVLDVDAAIMALGTSPNPLIRSTTKGLEANKRGCLIADETMKTTREGVLCRRRRCHWRCYGYFSLWAPAKPLLNPWTGIFGKRISEFFFLFIFCS